MGAAADEREARGEGLIAAIRASPIASVVTNPRLPDNPVIAANAAFLELTGYDEAEIVGRNCRFLAGPNTEPWQKEKVRAAIRSLRPSLTELLNYKKDGTPFRNALLIAPAFDEDGKLAWFIGSQVDVGGDADPLTLRQRRAAAMIDALSVRQREVLREMMLGLRNKQIAWRLALSEKTVKMHRSILLRKLGVTSSADAIRLAVEANL
jgi:PAS domain S-box-containing protein